MSKTFRRFPTVSEDDLKRSFGTKHQSRKTKGTPKKQTKDQELQELLEDDVSPFL